MLPWEAGQKMLPGQRVCGATIPQLPKPQPMDPIFKRPRQFMHEFPPPLVSQILTHSANLVSCKDSVMIEPRPYTVDNLSSGLQNPTQELPVKINPHSFMLLNQEVKSQPSQPLDPLTEQRKINESRMSMGSSSNSFQKNGPPPNARPHGDGFAPAIDPYSFYNRLCELFPDIHPPQLQRVFDECGRDFLRTIDNVLYARRLRKSIMAQMAKFRSQRRNQQNNSVPNPQQPKEQETSNFPQENQQQKPEKQTQQSPKSSASSKSASNSRAKRSRILAYQPSPTSNVHSSRKGGISSPKCSGTTQSPGVSMQQSIRKPSSPPPNVFVHQIDLGHPVSGGGDGTLTKKTNQGYIFSFKRPMMNAYGPLPHSSHHFNIPSSSCGDSNVFRPPLPPPPPMTFCSPHQLPLADWCPKDPIQFDPHMPPITTPQPQVRQNPQQDISDERIGLGLPSADQDRLPSDRNLEVTHRSGEPDPPEWTLLLKSIMDPMQAVDTNNDIGMINTAQPVEADEDYDNVNQRKQSCGNYFFKVNGPPVFSFLSDSAMKSTEGDCDGAQVAQTTSTHLGTKESDGSVNESVSVDTDINRKGEPQVESFSDDEEIKTTPPDIMVGSRKTLGPNCVN
ncbi:uncharacterized protein LOC124155555 isoform X2 [Ischnura elegans]|uniref:uncharacterized protein LOC124155555 isoform X2 n=1 Tax=Ischnura elegans TaxID=197161 RepID=UPI001ED88BE9|nr:uncharacterized protein LOC124155555 isoform X2 [Ischnura elegans]